MRMLIFVLLCILFCYGSVAGGIIGELDDDIKQIIRVEGDSLKAAYPGASISAELLGAAGGGSVNPLLTDSINVNTGQAIISSAGHIATNGNAIDATYDIKCDKIQAVTEIDVGAITATSGNISTSSGTFVLESGAWTGQDLILRVNKAGGTDVDVVVDTTGVTMPGHLATNGNAINATYDVYATNIKGLNRVDAANYVYTPKVSYSSGIILDAVNAGATLTFRTNLAPGTDVDVVVDTLGVTIPGRLVLNTLSHTAAGPTDDLDVEDVGVVLLDASGGSITIGGFTGGAEGQAIDLVRLGTANDVILEHAESTGNQDIYLSTEGDETLSTYGGWRLVCNGTHWYEVDN